MNNSTQKKQEALGRVIDTLDILRVQCPWDRKQTFESLRPNTIEETYELSDALLKGDYTEIRKELGDVLLHVLFYARIGEENDKFDISDVAESLNEKLIFRHPHIFGDAKVNSSHDVEQNWEEIKLKEKGGNRTVLAGVPQSLPSLIKAFRIQEKAANVGFDWEKREDVIAKIKEEVNEFEKECLQNNSPEMEAEFGDLLFSIVNIGRYLGINPDTALERTNQKFTSRFSFIEQKAGEMGRNLKDMTLAEMDALWNEAKKRHKE